jgi:hypothetical protein
VFCTREELDVWRLLENAPAETLHVFILLKNTTHQSPEQIARFGQGAVKMLNDHI